MHGVMGDQGEHPWRRPRPRSRADTHKEQAPGLQQDQGVSGLRCPWPQDENNTEPDLWMGVGRTGKSGQVPASELPAHSPASTASLLSHPGK